jgi:hypothetical protein
MGGEGRLYEEMGFNDVKRDGPALNGVARRNMSDDGTGVL